MLTWLFTGYNKLHQDLHLTFNYDYARLIIQAIIARYQISDVKSILLQPIGLESGISTIPGFKTK